MKRKWTAYMTGQIKKGNGGPGAPRVATQRDVSVSRPAGCADYVGFPKGHARWM